MPESRGLSKPWRRTGAPRRQAATLRATCSGIRPSWSSRSCPTRTTVSSSSRSSRTGSSSSDLNRRAAPASGDSARYMFGHPPELELEELPDPDDGVVVEPELEDGVVVVAMLAEPEPEPELEPEPVAACVIAAAPPAI